MSFLYDTFILMTWINPLLDSIFSFLNLDMNLLIVKSAHYFFSQIIKIFLLLTVIVFTVSFLQSYFPAEKTKNLISKYKGIKANTIAAFLGVLSPFCACSSIPIFIGVNRAGAPLGSSFSFLIASPLIDIASLIFLINLFGLKVGIIYTFLGILLAVIGGLIIDKLHLEKEILLDINSTVNNTQANLSSKDLNTTKACACSLDKNITSTPINNALNDTFNGSFNGSLNDTLRDDFNTAHNTNNSNDTNNLDNRNNLNKTHNIHNLSNTSSLNNTSGSYENLETSLTPLSSHQESCCAPKQSPVSKNCCSTEASAPCCAETNNTTKNRFIYSKNQTLSILKKVWIYMLISLAIGSFIHNYIPQEIIERVLGYDNPFSVILATLMGVPIYTDEMSSMIIGKAFYDKNVPIGTVISFMISAAALSIPSISILKSVMTTKLLTIFVSIVVVGVIIIGYTLNFLQFLFLQFI